ncbi:MAG TPA: DedA family protein [Spirochaetota bacterium]|nr:DedA family protein [Spirochaetota bacterium]
MIDVKEILMGMYPYVQYISFGLLMLSGMNVPISEDIVFIISASIAATVAPHNLYYIFAGCFLGAYLSDILAYIIGRYGLATILFSPFLARTRLVNPERLRARLDVMSGYFAAYGGKALFFGRFIPFGMRNAIFMTCGLIRMNPVKFMLIDLCAVTCTSIILFSLGYTFGNNYSVIISYLNKYKFVIASLILSVLVILIAKSSLKKRRKPAGEVINDPALTSKNLTGK